MAQRFIASENRKHIWPNGAIGYGNASPFDCLGPYAKVQNCPVAGHPDLRLTAYATGYADTAFSVPACTRYRGKHIAGYFTQEQDGTVFHPMDRHKDRLPQVAA